MHKLRGEFGDIDKLGLGKIEKSALLQGIMESTIIDSGQSLPSLVYAHAHVLTHILAQVEASKQTQEFASLSTTSMSRLSEGPISNLKAGEVDKLYVLASV